MTLGSFLMLELLLNMFTSEEKVQAMLTSPIIRFIFYAIIMGFLLTVFIHFMLYLRLKRLNHYVKSTERLDIEPFKQMVKQYDEKEKEHIPLETYIQEQFSKWTFTQIPIVSIIKMIRSTISIFILLGVLGTFIGLTISLGAIQTEGEALLEHIVLVLSGIDVAFYTSILGMSASLIITLLIRVFNTEYMLTDLMLTVESALATEKKQGMSQLIHVTESLKQSVDYLQQTNEKSLQEVVSSFTGFKDYTSGLERAAKDLATFNEGLTKNLIQFQTLFKQMEKNTKTFQQGTKTLNKNFNDLMTYFKGIDERNEYIITRLEQTFTNIEKTLNSQEEIAEKVNKSAQNLESFSTNFLDNQRTTTEQLSSVNRSLVEVAETLNIHNQTFRRLFGENMSSRLQHVGQYMKELAEQFKRLDESLYYLPDALSNVHESYQSHQQLMNDRYQEMKHFNETFHEHLREHKMEFVAFEQQIKQARDSFDEMNRNNHQLLQAITRTTQQINDSFYEKDQQLEQAIYRLQQTLQQFLERIEYHLGDELKQVQSNMQQTTLQLMQQIHDDFGQIQRLQEQIIQDQSRQFQQMIQSLHLKSLNNQSFAEEQTRDNTEMMNQVNRYER